jgi:hypothetical protein
MEIAVRLRFSKRTAAFHVGNILQKLGAASRTEARGKGKGAGYYPLMVWLSHHCLAASAGYLWKSTGPTCGNPQ